MMMKAKKSNRLSVLKYALVIPVVALTIVVTTNKNVTAKPILPIVQQGDDKVYEKVDVMPEFKGGMDALISYLGSKIIYPEEAKKNGTEGKVFIGFIVDNKGNIKEVNVVKSADQLLDDEAMRVIKAMPKWKPGEKDGKKVNVKFTLPISFKL